VRSWTYYDFGNFSDLVFDERNNTADISYPGHGYVPSPGQDNEGGELYDIEGLNFAYTGDTIYISLTSSFGQAVNSIFWGETYYAGDLFFGFDGTHDQFAIDLSDGSIWQVDSWNYITDKPGTYYSNPTIRFGVGAYSINSGTNLGAIDQLLTLYDSFEPDPMYAGETDTWVWEFMFDKDQLGLDINSYSTITFHNTVESGNDLLEKSFDMPYECGDAR